MRKTEPTTYELLFQRYGPTLALEQLAEVLKIAPKTAQNRYYRGELPIPTYKEGGTLVADAHEVAAYLDRRRAEAQRGRRAERPVAA